MHLVAKGGIGPGDPNWWEPKTDTTHIINFGLGTLSGIGRLIARTTKGKGH
ncbi:hypothetical protein PtB15_8B49 [Puccinia triticina]|nr:hypothetical protein PtB15_8B49 [Puccinia triticina]